MAACNWYAPTDPPRQGRGEERDALGDLLLIPQRSILFREWDQLAVGAGSCRAARIGQQHQGQQSSDFAIVREQLVNLSR